jgi:anti-sigma factor RsiW
MNCLECQELLQQRLDGLPLADRTALDRHLATCAECRERHAAVAVLEEGLRALPRPQPPPDLADRTTALVLQDRARRMRRQVWGAVALAASLLLAVGAYLWLVPSRSAQETVKGPTPKVEQPRPPKVEPSLRQSVDEAREALAALTGRFAGQAREEVRVLRDSASTFEFVSLEAVPQVAPLTQPFGSTAEGLRETSKGISTGMRTVNNSARRALSYFLRKTPPLQSAPKRANAS